MDSQQTLLVISTCLVLSAFFSGSETALLRLRTSDLDREAAGGSNPSAAAARALLRSTSRLLVTILIGNNVVNLLAAALASALAVRYFGEAVGVPLATALLTVLVLVFSEVLPKAFSARHPRRVAQLVSLPLYLMHQLLRPMHVAFDRVVEPLVRRLGGGEAEHASTAEDLLRLARAAAHPSATPTPASIIGGVARASEMHVSDIMVPRTEMFTLPIDTPPAALLERMLEEGFTRVPIHEGSVDRMLGVIHLKDLVGVVRSDARDLRPVLKPLLRVPERKEILGLLADMQRAFAHLAVVKDEFGVTLGMVTQEDILEEIVGEIRDEFDREELLTIRPAPDGGYLAVGRLKVIDFNRETGWDVPAERGDTLSGLVFNELGRAPRKGDAVQVPDYELRVVDVSGSRITEVRVARREEPVETAPEGGGVA